MKKWTILLTASFVFLIMLTVSDCTPLKQKVLQLQQQSAATVVEQSAPVEERTILGCFPRLRRPFAPLTRQR